MFKRIASSTVLRTTIAAGCALGVQALLAAPSIASPTTFFLDSYNSHNATQAFCAAASPMAPAAPGCGTVVTAPIVFETGVTYPVVVSGAVSAWSQWPFRRCGKPAPSSQFASSGRPNEPAGDDAQFRFATVLAAGKCPVLPKKTPYFQVNLGSGWFHPIATDNPSKPSKDDAKTGEQHPYTFSFTGKGVAPQFRFIDYHSSDNSGRFQIVVNP